MSALRQGLAVVVGLALIAALSVVVTPDPTRQAALATLDDASAALARKPLPEQLLARISPPVVVRQVVVAGHFGTDTDTCRAAAEAAVLGWAALPEPDAPPPEDGAVLGVNCTVAPPSAPNLQIVVQLGDDGNPDARLTADAPLPTGWALFPPLAAILVALITRRALPALLACIFLGAFVVEGGAPVAAVERAVVGYGFGTVADSFNLHVFGFTLLLIGMVGVSIAMGGMQGLVDALARFAKGVRSTQAVTALMGLAVFFDDYANTVVVGSTARPLTDSKGISREKLAYLVDSTAAPIAGVALVSSWIGVELSLFNDQLDVLRSAGAEDLRSGYDIFLSVLPYRFYCLFALLLIAIVAWTGRDFGPMLHAERRARARTGQPNPNLAAEARAGAGPSGPAMVEGAPPRWLNAVLPIAVVVAGTFGTSVAIGVDRAAQLGQALDLWTLGDLREAFVLIGDDRFEDVTAPVLFWSSVAGALTAWLLAVGQRILGPVEATLAFSRAVAHMLPTLAVLASAIAIRGVADDLATGRFVGALLGDVAPVALPLVVFLTAGAVAFATGTSWGTMGILMPIAVPLAAALAEGHPHETLLVLLTCGSVLDGAIFGDHCSLISDTTVMSSMASSCDHVEHVRTQIPYALLAMGVAALAGYLMTAALGLDSPWPSLLVGTAALYAVVRVVGRRA